MHDYFLNYLFKTLLNWELNVNFYGHVITWYSLHILLYKYSFRIDQCFKITKAVVTLIDY